MKRILFQAAFMLLSTTVSAQDVIVKKNGEEIRAKVEEVGEQSIRYRKFTNLLDRPRRGLRYPLRIGSQGYNHSARPVCCGRENTGHGNRRPVAAGDAAGRRQGRKAQTRQTVDVRSARRRGCKLLVIQG